MNSQPNRNINGGVGIGGAFLGIGASIPSGGNALLIPLRNQRDNDHFVEMMDDFNFEEAPEEVPATPANTRHGSASPSAEDSSNDHPVEEMQVDQVATNQQDEEQTRLTALRDKIMLNDQVLNCIERKLDWESLKNVRMVCRAWKQATHEAFRDRTLVNANIDKHANKAIWKFTHAFNYQRVDTLNFIPMRIKHFRFASPRRFLALELENFLKYNGHPIESITLGRGHENVSVQQVRRVLQVILKLYCPNVKKLVLHEILPGYDEFFPRYEEQPDTFRIVPYIRLDHLEVIALETGRTLYAEVVVLDVLSMIAAVDNFKMEFKYGKGQGLEALWPNLGVNTHSANLLEKATGLKLYNRGGCLPAGQDPKMFPLLKRLTIAPVTSVKRKGGPECYLLGRQLAIPTQLEELELRNVKLPFVTFPLMSKVKKFLMTIEKFGDDGLDFLSHFPNLEYAELIDVWEMDRRFFNPFFTPASVFWNARNSTLRTLKLTCKSVQFKNIDRCFPNLETLHVDLTCGNFCEDLYALSRLENLQKLKIVVGGAVLKTVLLGRLLEKYLPDFMALRSLQIVNEGEICVFPIFPVGQALVKIPKFSVLIIDEFLVCAEDLDEVMRCIAKDIGFACQGASVLKAKDMHYGI